MRLTILLTLALLSCHVNSPITVQDTPLTDGDMPAPQEYTYTQGGGVTIVTPYNYRTGR